MKNPRKIRAKQLIDNAMQETPEAVSGKRRCGIVLAVFLAARFLCLLAELTGAALGYFTISVQNIILFLVAVFFAWSIYIGIKMMALLGVVGGMIMVVQTFSLYPVLFDPEAYPFVRLYTAVFLLTAYVQVISMLFLVLEKKANIYYKTVFKARRQLMEEEKLQKRQ